MSARSIYRGTQRKLVFAFDVGTTYSGISYAILDPGHEPEIKPVTRFPGAGKVGGDAKVPTVIYYSADGIPRAIGAETVVEGIEALAEESQWTKAEWFKLHLRPKVHTSATVSDEIPPLPRGKTAVDVLADFLKYMNQCAKSYIEETHVDGVGLLTSGKFEFILSHPNAWEGAQQTLMRRAAVQAELIPDSPSGQERLSFVTEGEASLNFCIDKGLANESIKQRGGVIIVDAGGGTLDISTYARSGTSDDSSFEEIAAAQSYFKGSVFVTRAAHKYLTDFFHETRFSEDVPFMTEKFDKATKLGFRDPSDPQYIRFGGARDRDADLGIRAGQLKLDGNIVADFFEPSIQCIVDGVVEQHQLATQQIRTVFLVGGFAASDYLFSQVQKRLELYEIDVSRPDAHLNKAVPDGAIAGYLRPVVSLRVARFTYGIRSNLIYDSTKREHVKRSAQKFKLLSGEVRIPGGFWTLLEKNTKVSTTQEFRNSFFVEAAQKSGLSRERKTYITCYRGMSPCPEFINEDPNNFHDTFQIQANISKPIKKLKATIGPDGRQYFRLSYDIVILFGATEFKAQFVWKEGGVEKRGPAEILYDTELEFPV